MSARLWDIQTYRAHAGWKFSLRAWTVRPYNTPIFYYIRRGDWILARQEIEEHRASLFDRTEEGWTLLHVRASTLIRLITMMLTQPQFAIN